jgi:hypothetical protein
VRLAARLLADRAGAGGGGHRATIWA